MIHPSIVSGALGNLSPEDMLNLEESPEGIDLDVASETFLATLEAVRLIFQDQTSLSSSHLPNLLAFVAQETFRFTDILDAQNDLRVEQAQPEFKPECKKGCAYCCYLDVKASWAEIWALALALLDMANPEVEMEAEKRLTIAQLDEIVARVTSTATALSAVEDKDRCAVKIPCALLDTETNTCMAYADRPHACRGFNSISAQACKNGFGDPSHVVGMESVQQSLHAGTAVGLLNGLAEFNPALGGLIELNFGLSKVLPPAVNSLKRLIAEGLVG